MTRIKATMGDLADLVDRVNRTSGQIEEQLDTLAKGIATLRQEWEGAAAEAFTAKIDQWQSAADDLRRSLRRLGTIVNTTRTNYTSAVNTNTRMWPTG
jgi:WXG100 family type VII secretion target